MAQVFRGVRETVVRDVDTTTAADETHEVVARGPSVAERIVSLIGGIIVSLLGLRFILSLLGANRDNAFASFIYGLSHPFVAPFFGLFNYREQFGVSRIEVETLVAMAFWALLTWGIVYAISLGRRRERAHY
ncbi:MAG: hypothetical protein NVS1B7_0930 [Candidatus Saccharimonadales bacterium]